MVRVAERRKHDAGRLAPEREEDVAYFFSTFVASIRYVTVT
jgi:hypothetical protein